MAVTNSQNTVFSIKRLRMKIIKNRITVEGTGSQAPYGIGEIIETYRNTPAGIKKAIQHAAYWYNPAVVRGIDGAIIEVDDHGTCWT